MVKNGAKFEEGRTGKISLQIKLSKNSQKIHQCRFQRADSKNMAHVCSLGKIFKIFGFKANFLKNRQFGHFSDRFWKNCWSYQRNEAEREFYDSKSTRKFLSLVRHLTQ